MSYVDQLREQITSLLDDAEQKVRDADKTAPPQIREAVQYAVDHAGYGLGRLVPDSWVDEVCDILISSVHDTLDDCLKRIAVLREAAAYLGSPDLMRSMGDTFGDIGTAAENLQISKDDLAGYMSWDDLPASRQYEVSIEDQITALARVSPAVSSIKGVLRTHADDIENYYLALLQLVVSSVGAILGVVAAILSLVAGAITIETGVGPVLGIIGAALSLVVSLVSLVSAGIAAVQLLVQQAQGSANKLDALSTQMVEWKVPSFAEMG